MENAAEALVTMKEARTKLAEVKRDRGYCRAAPVDDKSKSNSKKQKSNCFDCGLPGHWAGDKECRKPGAKLGRKPKQVQIAEAMTTELYVSGRTAAEGETHEVLTVAVLPLSQSLAAAVEESHSHEAQRGELGCHGLTADKRLVGALTLHAIAPALVLIGFMVVSKVCKTPLKRSKAWCDQSQSMRRFVLETVAPRFLWRDGGCRPSGSSCQFLDFIGRCAFFRTFAGQRFFGSSGCRHFIFAA